MEVPACLHGPLEAMPHTIGGRAPWKALVYPISFVNRCFSSHPYHCM